MMNRLRAEFGLARSATTLIALLALPAAGWAQVAVDENGNPYENVEALGADAATGNEDIPLLSTVDLEELVGPIALYPDDLLAIVLPASAYPLQIVEAARFLEALEDDPSLKPDEDWDDSVVALTNYPEVVELLNDDIDWTWRLGDAVVSQQADVVAAIETFRDRAYAAGNLKSDSYQTVSRDEGVIEIVPIAEDVIYVPYYEPEHVVVYQPRPAYYYYPRPYPVYYYPYSSSHAFNRGYFWGVTTAFTIGWYSDSLNVFHHSYYGHPYYGRTYRNRWWYRRPTINIYNNHYVGGNTTVNINHHRRGDRWHARGDRREFRSDRRITRNRTYPVRRRQTVDPGSAASISSGSQRTTRSARHNQQERQPIAFRERPRTPTVARGQRGERSDRGVPARRTASRGTDTPGTRRTEPARVEPNAQGRRQPPEQRQIERADRQSRERRATPTPQLRRSQPIVQTRRTEPVRQSRPVQTNAQTRRITQANRSTQRPAPATQVRRSSQAAPQVRRSSQAAPQGPAGSPFVAGRPVGQTFSAHPPGGAQATAASAEIRKDERTGQGRP